MTDDLELYFPFIVILVAVIIIGFVTFRLVFLPVILLSGALSGMFKFGNKYIRDTYNFCFEALLA